MPAAVALTLNVPPPVARADQSVAVATVVLVLNAPPVTTAAQSNATASPAAVALVISIPHPIAHSSIWPDFYPITVTIIEISASGAIRERGSSSTIREDSGARMDECDLMLSDDNFIWERV